MLEILSFFSFKTSFIIVAVLMLLVGLFKIHNLLQVNSADCSLFSLKTTQPWMTFLCRLCFYLALFVVMMAAINLITQNSGGAETSWWISVFQFCYYGVIGFILQMAMMVAIVVVILLVCWGVVNIMEALHPTEAK